MKTRNVNIWRGRLDKFLDDRATEGPTGLTQIQRAALGGEAQRNTVGKDGSVLVLHL